MRLYTQFLTCNACYTAGRAIRPAGVMVHSTGANNPDLGRYVPGDERIGLNTGGNHWNQSNSQWKEKFGVPLNKCVHAFVGRCADGGVGAVQTLPWTMRGWHAGKSEGNDRYIGFEICEDGLEDPVYFAAVYREAVELTAMLCKRFGFDPLADGVVICHAEGYRRGVASNHGDVLHWFGRHKKTMDDFRADVAWCLEEEKDMTPRYNTMDEIRAAAPWAEKALCKAVGKGYITGGGKKDAQGGPADMDLSMDMIRMIVMLDAAGVFGL